MSQLIAGSKSRPTARKRILDDAAFTVSGSKRSMSAMANFPSDKHSEGTPEPRLKRKRVDASYAGPVNSVKRPVRSADDLYLTLNDFISLSTETLHRYLLKYDIIPPIYPDPQSHANPPLPASLLSPVMPPHPPSPMHTPANRPQRRQELGSRRRSSRLIEEAERDRRVVVASDVDEIHNVLAEIVHRHWLKNNLREHDVVGPFLFSIRAQKERARLRGLL